MASQRSEADGVETTGDAGHWMVEGPPTPIIDGACVSLAITSFVHVLEQPASLVMVKVSTKEVPQAVPAITVTVCPFVTPEIEPFPVIDQA